MVEHVLPIVTYGSESPFYLTEITSTVLQGVSYLVKNNFTVWQKDSVDFGLPDCSALSLFTQSRLNSANQFSTINFDRADFEHHLQRPSLA